MSASQVDLKATFLSIIITKKGQTAEKVKKSQNRWESSGMILKVAEKRIESNTIGCAIGRKTFLKGKSKKTWENVRKMSIKGEQLKSERRYLIWQVKDNAIPNRATGRVATRHIRGNSIYILGIIITGTET